MTLRHGILVFLALLISSAAAAAGDGGSSDLPTAYEMLQKYGLPEGLLPTGVVGYNLSTDDGSFTAFLAAECRFRVAGGRYTLHYDRTIRGVARQGMLTKLAGVKVKVLFVSVRIDTVASHGDEVSFSAGPLSASFPTNSFRESPDCRCGFDCGTAAAA